MPVYLQLCIQTWHKAIPDLTISIINHANVHTYLPKVLLTESFYKLPLAMQSDVVSVWVLLSRGGLFIDVDTIITANPFSNSLFNADKLFAFGYQARRQIHLAVMFSQQPLNILLNTWIIEVTKKLAQPLPSPLPWDLVGNSIINKLLSDTSLEPHYQILEVAEYGNIAELSLADENPYNRYIKFYFTPPIKTVSEIKQQTKGGMISLHNSWTPDIYRNATLQDIIKSKDSLMLSHLLINLVAA